MENTEQLSEQYVVLLQKSNELTARLESTDNPERVSLLRQGLEAIDEQIGAIGATDDFRQSVVDGLELANDTLDDIELLDGVLPTEELDLRRAEVHETMHFLGAVSVRHNIDTDSAQAATQVSPLNQPITSTNEVALPTRETLSPIEQQHVEPLACSVLKVKDKVFIQLGKGRGQKIPLSGRTYERQTDYTAHRLVALRLVAESEAEVSPNQIWEALQAEGLAETDTSLDRGVIGNIRAWFENSVTFRRSPVVVHNGLRGAGSRYGLNYPLTIDAEAFDTVLAHLRDAPAEQPASASSGEPSIPAESFYDRLTISPKEAYIFVTFLSMHADILQRAGIKTPEPTLLAYLEQESAKEIATDSVRTGTAPTNEEVMEQVRMEAMEKFQAIITSEEEFLEFVADVDEDDPIYELFTYLLDIDGDESWEIITQLVAGRRGLEITLDAGSFSRGQDIVSVRPTFDGQLGELTTAQSPETVDSFIADTVDTPQTPEEPFFENGETGTIIAFSEPDSAMEIPERSTDNRGVAAEEVVNTRSPQELYFETALQTGRETIEQLRGLGLKPGSEGFKPNRVGRMVRNKDVRNASENGVIGRDKNLSSEKILRVKLYSADSNGYKLHRATADRVVETLMQEWRRAVEKAQQPR